MIHNKRLHCYIDEKLYGNDSKQPKRTRLTEDDERYAAFKDRIPIVPPGFPKWAYVIDLGDENDEFEKAMNKGRKSDDTMFVSALAIFT